jgi:hypothetical protein
MLKSFSENLKNCYKYVHIDVHNMCSYVYISPLIHTHPQTSVAKNVTPLKLDHIFSTSFPLPQIYRGLTVRINRVSLKMSTLCTGTTTTIFKYLVQKRKTSPLTFNQQPKI